MKTRVSIVLAALVAAAAFPAASSPAAAVRTARVSVFFPKGSAGSRRDRVVPLARTVPAPALLRGAMEALLRGLGGLRMRCARRGRTMKPTQPEGGAMTILAHHPLPAVQAYETEDELVLEIEFPADAPHVKAELNDRLLKLTISRPPRHPAWEAHPAAGPS